jgi:hypothetical protein
MGHDLFCTNFDHFKITLNTNTHVYHFTITLSVNLVWADTCLQIDKLVFKDTLSDEILYK